MSQIFCFYFGSIFEQSAPPTSIVIGIDNSLKTPNLIQDVYNFNFFGTISEEHVIPSVGIGLVCHLPNSTFTKLYRQLIGRGPLAGAYWMGQYISGPSPNH